LGATENRRLVTDAFAAWETGDSGPFFALVADDVSWTVIGTTPVSGHYRSKREFVKGALARLSERLDGGITAHVVNVLADGDHVALQWEGTSASRTGLPYRQTYCWVMRLADGRIEEVTAYLDTELVSAMFHDAGGDAG
jgi:ketosteroid isomerase-like protein